MKPLLKIKFVDLCSNPEKAMKIVKDALSVHYVVEESDVPDVVLFTGFGDRHRNYPGLKIYYTGENIRPPMFACDFAFSHDYLESPRHFRFPHYGFYEYIPELAPKPVQDIDNIINGKTRFCSFVVSNAECQRRIDFFHLLCEYKKVDSGGKLLNNIGGRVQDKHEFLKESKFNICFENSQYPGYTTEKITDAMRAMCIPIYWGSQRVNEEFNPQSFINVDDYDNDQKAIDAIAKLDQDSEAYRRMLSQPWFPHDQLPSEFTQAGMADLLKKAIEMGPATRTFSDHLAATAYYGERKLRSSARTLKSKIKR